MEYVLFISVTVPNNDEPASTSDSAIVEPFYVVDEETTCAIGSFEDLVNESDLVFEEVPDSDVDLSPLVKEEIKFKIINRRLAEGKDELKVEFRDPSPERVSTQNQ